MSRRDEKLLLEDIRMSIEKITSYVEGYSYQDFEKDSKTIDAVVRNFEIIGEAANRLPELFKENNPDIPWFRLRGFRNRIVHDYMGIDLLIVWSIIENDLGTLLKQIGKLLAKK